MLQIVVWKWSQANFREVYTSEHVNVMADMLERHMGKYPYRLMCITDDPTGIDTTKVLTAPLWKDHDTLRNASGMQLPSCYRRLRLFDPATQQSLGFGPKDRICSIDLDAVVTGDLSKMFSENSEARFVGWKVRGTYHPWVFNGSFFMFGAGDLDHIWTKFDPKTSPQTTLKRGFFGSDQSWLSFNLAREPYAGGIRWPTIASYPREIRRLRRLDNTTRIVFFHGTLKPWHPKVQSEAPWIAQHWRAS